MDPLTLSLIIGGAGAGLSALGKSKQKKAEPEWYVDPWVQRLRDIQTPMMSPSYYNVPTSGVQTATEQGVLSGLGRSLEDIKGQYGPEAAQKYYTAEKARRQEGYGEQQTSLKDLLQREGVLTSTPGLEAQTKLKTQQGKEMESFGSQLMYEDIARDLQATQLAEQTMQNYLTQGQTLGAQQFQQGQWPYVMAQSAVQGGQGLGSMGYMPEAETNWMQDVGGAGLDASKMLLMLNMLKGKTATKPQGTTNTGYWSKFGL